MTEWTVAVVLISLMGMVISVLTPAIKLNTSVTKLTTLVDTLNNKLIAMDTNNAESHRRIWNELDEHKGQIHDHDTRITLLEKEGHK